MSYSVSLNRAGGSEQAARGSAGISLPLPRRAGHWEDLCQLLSGRIFLADSVRETRVRRAVWLQGSRKREEKRPAWPARLPRRRHGGGRAQDVRGRDLAYHPAPLSCPILPALLLLPRPPLHAPPLRTSSSPPLLFMLRLPLLAPPSSSRPVPFPTPRPLLHAPPSSSRPLPLLLVASPATNRQTPLAQLAAAEASVARPRRGGSGAAEGQLRGPRPRGAVGAGRSRGRAGAAAAPTDMRPVS